MKYILIAMSASHPVFRGDIFNYVTQFLDTRERLLCADVCSSIRKCIVKNPNWHIGLDDNIYLIDMPLDLLTKYSFKILQLKNPVICIPVNAIPQWRDDKYIDLKIVHNKNVPITNPYKMISIFKNTAVRYKLIRYTRRNPLIVTTIPDIREKDILISEYVTYGIDDLKCYILHRKIPLITLNGSAYTMFYPREKKGIIRNKLRYFIHHGTLKIIGSYAQGIRWTWRYKEEEIVPLYIFGGCDEIEINYIFSDMTQEDISRAAFIVHHRDAIDRVTVNGTDIRISVCNSLDDIVLTYISEECGIPIGITMTELIGLRLR
jgi:hypothetical protein